MKVIGIDPGISGAFACFNADSKVATFLDMPSYKIQAKGSRGRAKSELDMHAIIDYLLGHDAEDEVVCVIEKQQAFPTSKAKGGSQGVVSTGTTMMNYGILLGIITALRIPCERVAAASWKRKMMADMPKEKDASIVVAKRLLPTAAGDLTRKKDHGRADALLLALYGIRHLGVLAHAGEKPF